MTETQGQNREEIKIDLELTENDLRRTFFGRNRRVFLLLAAATLVIGIPIFLLVSILWFLDTREKSILPLIAGSGPILFFLFVYLVIRSQIAMQIRQIVPGMVPTRMRFTSSGVRTRSHIAISKTAWEAYTLIDETKSDFVFYLQTNIFYTIPKRFFSSEDQIQKLRNLINEHAVGIINVFEKTPPK